MSTQKRKNLEKLIFNTLDKEIEGTDIYNNNGSMWLIFTDEKRWAIEFTKERTLWYNYYIFNNVLMLFGMDNGETAEYVKKWFENRFLFKPKVENTIQNGVKSTLSSSISLISSVENTIQNGVKSTSRKLLSRNFSVENTIQNGVKSTRLRSYDIPNSVENTIQNGVKRTVPESIADSFAIEDTIQNGVKEINHVDVMKFFDNKMEVALQNGVKVMMSGSEWYHQDEVEDLIEKRVKEDKN